MKSIRLLAFFILVANLCLGQNLLKNGIVSKQLFENKDQISVYIPELKQELTFTRANILSSDFSVVDHNNKKVKVKTGNYYWSSNGNKYNASLSVNGKEINCTYISNEGTFELTGKKGQKYEFNKVRKNPFNCFTEDKGDGLKIDFPSEFPNCRTVNIYFEADYQLFQNKGSSITNTVNYVNSLFAQVALLYANEQIPVQISQIKVWDTPDPYRTYTSIAQVLNVFRQNLNGNFNGNLAHLLSTRSLGGGIGYVDVLCFKQYAYGVSQITTSFSNVPTYSWSVEVVTHELGHNLGSWHTHSCNWPGGALDNCYPPEGSCQPGPAPINGGTIMSYCHLTQYGINFNNGFGPIPGNYIRSKYNSASCLSGTSNPPTALNVTNISTNSALLSWSPVSGTTYELQWKKSSNNTWNIVSNLTLNQYQLSGLDPNTSYDWKVKTNCSIFSVTNTFTTQNISNPCPIASNVQVSNITQTSAKITWNFISGVNTYNLQYKNASAVNWIEYSGIPSNSLNLNNLTPNTTYLVKVRPDCNQTFTSPIQFTTLPITNNPCDPPTNLQVTNLTSTSATLSWTGTNPPYQIALKFPGSDHFTFLGQLFQNPTVNFYGFNTSSTYQWKVKSSCSDWSAINTFTTPSNLINNKVIFPNPTTGKVHILNSDSSRGQLFDINGRLIKELDLNMEIDLSDLQSGIYYIKINDQTYKVVKI